MVFFSKQNTLTLVRALITATILLGIVAPTVIAQESSPGSDVSVTDQELEQFVAALEEIQEIQEQMVADTEASVEDSSMERGRFEELLQANQNGTPPQSEPNEAEQAEFQRLLQEIQTIQRDSNQLMVEAVRSEEMEVRRYNQIAQALQQDPALMERLQAIRQNGNS